MTYTAGEVAKKLGLSKDGLRYYEREGLLPQIARDNSGHRAYTDADIEWIFLIRCLRDTDMKISTIKQYVSLLMRGGVHSIPERRQILLEHQQYIHGKVDAYLQLSKLIEKKIAFYDDALGNPAGNGKCMDYADEWAHFQTILGGVEHD